MLSVNANTSEKSSSPERTCIGCRRASARGDLLRLSVVEMAPYVVPDVAAKLGGRGAWVCPRRSCVRAAVRKGGIARATSRKVEIDPETLAAQLVGQLQRRIEGLLSSAARSRRVAVGTDAVGLAIEGGGAKLLVVASDAAGRREELEDAARRAGLGRIVFGDKISLGQTFGRGEVGVLSVLDEGIAAELERAAEQVTALSEDE